MPWKCEVPRSSHSDKDGFATTKLDHAEMEDTVPPDRMDGGEEDLKSHKPIQEQNYSSNQPLNEIFSLIHDMCSKNAIISVMFTLIQLPPAK